MTMLLRIAERVLNRPLLVHPDKLPLLLAVLQGRIPIGQDADWRAEVEARIDRLPVEQQQIMRGPLPEASRFEGDFYTTDAAGKVTGRLPYRRTAQGVAVLPVLGGLVNRGTSAEPFSMSKASYEALKFQFQHAAADDATKAVLLDIASPGGEATGAFEAAAAVRALAAKKPVTAVVNGMAASAAYAMAAAANRIVTTQTGVSGSIGVVMLHADFSRALDKEGITPTLIFAGAHKVDGHPFAPLPDGVREDLQREVNAFYDQFVQTVAAGRKQLSPAMIRATEARTYIGQDAVDAGIADELGSFESALADLSRGSSRIVATSSTSKGHPMTDKTQGDVAAVSATVSQSEHDAAIGKARADGRAEGVTEGRKAGADAERERILGIERLAVAGHDKLVADCKADPAMTPEKAAMRILEAEKATRGMQAQMIVDVERQTNVVKPAPSASDITVPAADTPEGWTAQYEKSAQLRAEFETGAEYLAFKKAEAAGKVRFLRKSA